MEPEFPDQSDGCDDIEGGVHTESVAAAEKAALPQPFDTMQRYWYPFWDDAAVKLYVEETAANMVSHVPPPFVLLCH